MNIRIEQPAHGLFLAYSYCGGDVVAAKVGKGPWILRPGQPGALLLECVYALLEFKKPASAQRRRALRKIEDRISCLPALVRLAGLDPVQVAYNALDDEEALLVIEGLVKGE